MYDLVEGESPQVIVLDRRGRLTGNETIFSLGPEVWVFHQEKEIKDHRWITVDSVQPLIPEVFETMLAHEMNTLLSKVGVRFIKLFSNGLCGGMNFVTLQAEERLGHGIAAPAIPAGCAPYVTENIGNDEMVILRSKQTWQNFISL